MVPDNGTAFPGNFYSFQVGSVLFISLDANDICYQGPAPTTSANTRPKITAGAGNTIPTTEIEYNQYYTGNFSRQPQRQRDPRTCRVHPQCPDAWLELPPWPRHDGGHRRLDRRHDAPVCVSISTETAPMRESVSVGCPFRQYQVDLVVNGHDHDYERSWPVRGFTPNLGTQVWPPASLASGDSYFGYPASTPLGTSGTLGVQTWPPEPSTGTTPSPPLSSTTDKRAPSTRSGHGVPDPRGGGTKRRTTPTAAMWPRSPRSPRSGSGQAVGANSREGPNRWSTPASRLTGRPRWDSTDSYGVALFSVDPGTTAGGLTTITVTYYDAPTTASGAPNYSPFETFQLQRSRSDQQPSDGTPGFAYPAAAVAGAAALAAGAVYVTQRRRATAEVGIPE